MRKERGKEKEDQKGATGEAIRRKVIHGEGKEGEARR